MLKNNDPKEQKCKIPGKKIHQIGDIDSQSGSEDDLYSPTYAFKGEGCEEYMVQPRVKVAGSSEKK